MSSPFPSGNGPPEPQIRQHRQPSAKVHMDKQDTTSKLLLDEYPLLVLPKLACAIGLNQAIALQQIHYWVKNNERIGANKKKGFTWTYNTIEGWQAQFPFWSLSTIKRTLSILSKQKLIITDCLNKLKIDRTTWYRINYEKLNDLITNSIDIPLGQIEPMQQVNVNRPLPETTQETIFQHYMYEEQKFHRGERGNADIG